MRKIRSHFPDVEFVTYSVEEPCFTSCLPQILKLYGFKIRLPEVSEYLLGAGTRRPTAANWSTGSAPTQFDPHFAAPCLRRAPEKLGVADHGMGQ